LAPSFVDFFEILRLGLGFSPSFRLRLLFPLASLSCANVSLPFFARASSRPLLLQEILRRLCLEGGVSFRSLNLFLLGVVLLFLPRHLVFSSLFLLKFVVVDQTDLPPFPLGFLPRPNLMVAFLPSPIMVIGFFSVGPLSFLASFSICTMGEGIDCSSFSTLGCVPSWVLPDGSRQAQNLF